MADEDIEELMEMLDDVLSARDKLTCAEIDAGCCQTRMDREKVVRCRDDLYTAKTHFEEALRLKLRGL